MYPGMLISGNATIAAPASRARSMNSSMDRTLRSGLPARTFICASATVGRAAGTTGFAIGAVGDGLGRPRFRLPADGARPGPCATPSAHDGQGRRGSAADGNGRPFVQFFRTRTATAATPPDFAPAAVSGRAMRDTLPGAELPGADATPAGPK